MKHLVEFPAVNGLRLVPVETTRNRAYNRVHMDDVLASELYQDDEQPAGYCQKFQLQDGIAFQLSTNASVVGDLRFYDCELNLQQATVGHGGNTAQVPGNMLYGTALTTYLFIFAAGEYPRLEPGKKYYGILTLTWDDGFKQDFVTETLHFEHIHPATVLIEYRNAYNHQDFIWEDFTVRCGFRVEGGISEMKEGGKSVVAENGDYSPVLLSANRWRSFTLRAGNGTGLPDWVADKIDAIFACDSVSVDGKYFQRDESSAVEIKQVERTALRDVSIKLREQVNGEGTRYNLQRIDLGPMPPLPFRLNSLDVSAIGFDGRIYESYVSGRTIWYSEDWLAVLAWVNGRERAFKGDGGYLKEEGGRLYFQTGKYLEANAVTSTFSWHNRNVTIPTGGAGNYPIGGGTSNPVPGF